MGTMHFSAYPELHKHVRSLLVYFYTMWVQGYRHSTNWRSCWRHMQTTFS